MKNWKKFLVFLTLGFAIVFATVSIVRQRVYAVEGCNEDDYDCVKGKIEEYKKKINELQGQQKTLSSTISYLDGKVKLTEGEIKKTQIEIAILQKEIGALSAKISGLEVSLQKLSETLVKHIQTSYKMRSREPIQYILNGNTLEDTLERYKYQQVSQKHMQDIIKQNETQKLVFNNEKELKEQKQLEIEKLRKKLEVQQKDLTAQKAQKQTLLDQTKNDEKKYQSLLSQALAEKNALEAALVSGTKVGPVKQGDAIALVGNSGYPGCSTGEHLHFEIRKNNTWVDPAGYLKSKTVIDEQSGGETTLGSGSWEWPIQEPVRLTQKFGQTPYSWRYKYSGGIHTGYDMVSKSSRVIKAPADGVLYSSSQSCGSSSTINIKYIEHGDGVISFYLHVQ